jgi:hypothetical protein
MAETKTLDATYAKDLFEELAWTSDGQTHDGWTRVAEFDGYEARWVQWKTLVLSDTDGNLWGLEYGAGRSEMQDHVYPWENGRSVDLVRLYAYEVRRVEYRTEAPA